MILKLSSYLYKEAIARLQAISDQAIAMHLPIPGQTGNSQLN